MIVEFDKAYNLYIDGKWVPASNGGTFEVRSLTIGGHLVDCAEAIEKEMDTTIKATRIVFPE